VSAPCVRCNGPKADLLDLAGRPICRGCQMAAEAETRLAKGRTNATIRSIIGLVIGSVVLVMCMLATPAAFADRASVRTGGRVLGIGYLFAVVVLGTCTRNLMRLRDSKRRS